MFLTPPSSHTGWTGTPNPDVPLIQQDPYEQEGYRQENPTGPRDNGKNVTMVTIVSDTMVLYSLDQAEPDSCALCSAIQDRNHSLYQQNLISINYRVC